MSAAFDKVWHAGLLAKLKKYGITGKLHAWIEDYLANRKQRVVLEGRNSEYRQLSSGVPQGSILGPLLFLVYINDLASIIKTNIRMYADDSSLYIDYGSRNPKEDRSEAAKEGAKKLQEDINRVEDWAKKWLVTFNPTDSICHIQQETPYRKT